MSTSRLQDLPQRELPGGLTVISASTLRAWLFGLGGLDGLPDDQALELRSFCVDTMSVRFPLDLIWLNRGGTVKRIDRNVPSRRVRLCFGARRVVECNAGQADAFVAALNEGVPSLTGGIPADLEHPPEIDTSGSVPPPS